MEDDEIYKSLLQVVQLEASLEQKSPKTECPSISQLLSAITKFKSLIDSSKIVDLSAISGHYIRCSVRLLGKRNDKMTIETLFSLELFFQRYRVQTSLSNSLNSNTQDILSLFHALVLLLDSLKPSIDSLSAEQEVIVESCFIIFAIAFPLLLPVRFAMKCLQLDLVHWMEEVFVKRSTQHSIITTMPIALIIDEQGQYELSTALQNSFVVQLTHSSMMFLAHRAKKISVAALRVLVLLMLIFSGEECSNTNTEMTVLNSSSQTDINKHCHVEMWRQSLPGIFSGLCVECLKGTNR